MWAVSGYREPFRLQLQLRFAVLAVGRSLDRGCGCCLRNFCQLFTAPKNRLCRQPGRARFSTQFDGGLFLCPRAQMASELSPLAAACERRQFAEPRNNQLRRYQHTPTPDPSSYQAPPRPHHAHCDLPAVPTAPAPPHARQ